MEKLLAEAAAAAETLYGLTKTLAEAAEAGTLEVSQDAAQFLFRTEQTTHGAALYLGELADGTAH